jgi:hypothetical protein
MFVYVVPVLLLLVFSNADTPYPGVTLPEAVQKIRNGELLPQLPADMCADDIHQKLIAVCFNSDASLRPTFKELYDQAVQLGASEDADAVQHHKAVRSRSIKMSTSKATLTPTQVLERQGPSVQLLSTDFIKNTLKAVSNQMATMEGISDPSDAKIDHMVQAYGKPVGLTAICPRDGKRGAAYVDTLTGADNVGIADALLSCSWGYKVRVGS